MTHSIFYPFAVDLDGTLIDGTSSQSIDPGAQIERPVTDGGADPSMAIIGSKDGNIQMSTTAIGKFLSGIGGATDLLNGFELNSSALAALFCRAAVSGGSRDTAGALKVLVNKGLVVPVSLSAGNGPTPGALQYLIAPVWDGTNAPLVFTASQTLSGAPDADESFFAGPCLLNNVAVDGIQQVSVQFGIQLKKVFEKGQPLPNLIYIDTRLPVITIITHNVDLAATYSGGVAITATTYAMLRAAEHGGSRVLDATAAHPQFAVSKGLIISRAISGAPQSMAIDIIPALTAAGTQVEYELAAIA